jgi:hypothetical protein
LTESAKGKRKIGISDTGRKGPVFVLPNLAHSEDEVKTAAGAFEFTGPGIADAWAEADVIVSGYGYPIDGKWKAETVLKRVTVDGGFMGTVSVSAGNEAKAGGQKGTPEIKDTLFND